MVSRHRIISYRPLGPKGSYLPLVAKRDHKLDQKWRQHCSRATINPIYILLRFIQWQWFVATLLTNTRHSNFTQCWTNAGSALIQHCVNASCLLGCSSCSPCVRTGLCCLWNVWRPGWGSWAEPRACLCAPPAGAPPGCAAPPPAPAHCATLRGKKTDLLNLKVKIYDSHMGNITG